MTGKKGERTYDDPSDDPDQTSLFEAVRDGDASLYEYEEDDENDEEEEEERDDD